MALDQTTTTPKNGPTTAKMTSGEAKKERKIPVRAPRTDEEKVFAACSNVLRKTTPDIRARVMRSLTALYAS